MSIQEERAALRAELKEILGLLDRTEGDDNAIDATMEAIDRLVESTRKLVALTNRK